MKYYIIGMPDDWKGIDLRLDDALERAIRTAKEVAMFNPVVDTPCMVVDTWTGKPDKTKPISEVIIKGQVKISGKPVSLWVVRDGKDNANR